MALRLLAVVLDSHNAMVFNKFLQVCKMPQACAGGARAAAAACSVVEA